MNEFEEYLVKHFTWYAPLAELYVSPDAFARMRNLARVDDVEWQRFKQHLFDALGIPYTELPNVIVLHDFPPKVPS